MLKLSFLNIIREFFLIGIFLLFFSCPGLTNEEQISYDTDADGFTDLHEFYENGHLIKLEIDLDKDGIMDIFQYYRNDHLMRVESCYQLDSSKGSGTINWWKYFENDLPVLEKRDQNDDGKVDWLLHYKNGKKFKIEADTNFDGKMDRWEYLRDDAVIRLELDEDGDGKPEIIKKLKSNLPTGPILLKTDPSGAFIWINNKLTGQTPMVIKLPSGSHTINFRMEGYKEMAYVIKLQENQSYTFDYKLRADSKKMKSQKPDDDEQTGIDTNADGMEDVFEYRVNGILTGVEKDADFNKKIDRWEYFFDNKLIGVVIDNNFDGIGDEWWFFKNDQKVRVEKDENFDGIIETIID
ncbi:MAG: hypothetical protein A2161_17380 [Candidatus Schekmanbacteria bacterium RBG_13_48_7]|uniref:PEGA domain-containing protein n=1 Tax=Candidatus Schekmanbacteria bacterium RBG_13_48_7 TaxID=1817878 RepID=A0A1F7RX09_9BACT|nr:MAG: hypothetical protein A2161_17380 [Candidatus Schekmanbacteria bacterium RBG_13_48_7]